MFSSTELPLFDQQSILNNMVHTQGAEFFTKYECYQVQIFFYKKKYTIKQIDCSTKIKIIYCYVMSIELAGGEDKFYFDSFIQIEIPFLKVSQS